MPRELTSLQEEVVRRLRKRQYYWTASAAKEAWQEGRPYYIDNRVDARGLRRDFEECNRQAEMKLTPADR